MSKIKVEEILKKHWIIEDDTNSAWIKQAKNAVKEIVELAIDKCAKEANSKDVTSPNCSDHTPYWGACVTCGRIDNPNVITGSEVDKQSILQVKQMINYEW